MTALATIRKAVGAGVGVLVTGGYTVLQADNFHLSALSQGQVSSVLFGALATGVAVFGLKNKALEAVIGEVEHVVADKGATAVVDQLPSIANVLQPALDALAGSVAALPAAPADVVVPPILVPDPVPAVAAVDVSAGGAHAAPDTLAI